VSGDPAAVRWAAMQLSRLLGAVMVVAGMLIAAGRLPALNFVPPPLAYLLIAAGLAEFFVVPLLLARRWRSGGRGAGER